MRKLTILLMILVLSASVLFVGCSDDDDNPVGSSLKPLTIFGAVYISSQKLNGYIEFWDISASGKTLDSAKIGDNITITDFESWYWVGDDNYWGSSLSYYYDSSYSSGDTINIKLYDEGTVADVDIVLMDRSTDVVSFVEEPSSPISMNTPFDLTWTSHPLAEFYTVTVSNSWTDINGHYQYNSSQFTTTDTTMTISAEFSAHAGDLSYNVYPYRGNVPTGEGAVAPNVETSTMSGNIWTYGDNEYGSVTVAVPVSAPPVSDLKNPSEQDMVKLNNRLMLGK